MAPAPESACRSMVPRRTFPAGGHAGPPLRKVRAPQRVGADLCVGPCPAREGQRQRLRSRWRLCRLTLDSRPRICRATDVASPLRGDAAYPLRVKSAQRVSGTSPGRRLPQGQRVSVPDCRAGQPTFPRRRQEVRAGADRPAETFFLFHRARRIFFLMSQTGAPAAPRAVGRGGAAEGARPGPAGRGERSEACADDNGGCIGQAAIAAESSPISHTFRKFII